MIKETTIRDAEDATWNLNEKLWLITALLQGADSMLWQDGTRTADTIKNDIKKVYAEFIYCNIVNRERTNLG